jgi:hypothetical protein
MKMTPTTAKYPKYDDKTGRNKIKRNKTSFER